MTETCGAKNRKGGLCGRSAGWGTRHLGVGKCKMHGGATPIKHGLYSKYASKTLSTTINEMENHPELLNVKQQIAFKQALTMERLKQLQEKSSMSQDDVRFLAEMSERVSRDIERQHKIEHGEKFVLKLEEVQSLVNQIIVIIRQEVGDEQAINRVAQRLQDVKW